jgi:hypothetical protein
VTGTVSIISFTGSLSDAGGDFNAIANVDISFANGVAALSNRIVINTDGAFFKNGASDWYPNSSGVSIYGASPKGQGTLLLHEFGHWLGLSGIIGGDAGKGQANNDTVLEKCGMALGMLSN